MKAIIKILYDITCFVIVSICMSLTVWYAYLVFKPYYDAMSMTILAEIMMLFPCYLMWRYFRSRI